MLGMISPFLNTPKFFDLLNEINVLSASATVTDQSGMTVTNGNGNPVTQSFVAVTDNNGNVVTDTNGNPVTQVANVVTDVAGNVVTNSNGNPVVQPINSYDLFISI